MQLIILGGPETENERRHWRYHRLKHRLQTEVLAKLTAGSLQATGFEFPVDLDDERRLIRAAWWEKLDPDFDASEAKGPGGLHLVDIRVQETPPAWAGLADPKPGEQGVLGGQVSLAKLRADIRRWLEGEARTRGTSWQKKHYFEAACAKFGDRVTNNLFNEVWRATDLPEELRRPGLRKSARGPTDPPLQV
jgi:hypothetical protein